MLEIANFGKHEVTGPAARTFLDRLLAAKLPKPGRIVLSPMLGPKGKLAGDLTVTCLSEEHFLLLGSGAAQKMHRRWFEANLPAVGVTYRNVSDSLHGVAIAAAAPVADSCIEIELAGGHPRSVGYGGGRGGAGVVGAIGGRDN